jgi:hypothetical protein
MPSASPIKGHPRDLIGSRVSMPVSIGGMRTTLEKLPCLTFLRGTTQDLSKLKTAMANIGEP